MTEFLNSAIIPLNDKFAIACDLNGPSTSHHAGLVELKALLCLSVRLLLEDPPIMDLKIYRGDERGSADLCGNERVYCLWLRTLGSDKLA